MFSTLFLTISHKSLIGRLFYIVSVSLTKRHRNPASETKHISHIDERHKNTIASNVH